MKPLRLVLQAIEVDPRELIPLSLEAHYLVLS